MKKETKKKKGKSKGVGRIFIQGFIKSLLILSALLFVGFLSYQGTLVYYKNHGGPKNDKMAAIIKEMYGEVEVVDISQNLIYCVGEDGSIKAIVLEVFNTLTGNMDYITIPMKSTFTISNELYQKLCAAGSEVPQIIKLSKIDDYFTDETLYEYGAILVGDLLDTRIHYYTAADVNTFKEMFIKRDAELAVLEDGTAINSDFQWEIKTTFIKKIRGLKEDSEIEDFLVKRVNACKSNLNLKSKLEYLGSYKKINPGFIYTHSIYGRLEGNKFEIEAESSQELLERILQNEPYTTKQKNAKKQKAVPSIGYAIEILNASQITGLAAAYKESFENNGYTISGIGNYQGQKMSQTKIIISQEGLGEDLLSYFSEAVIEVGQLPENVDIQVILGTNDRLD